MIDISKGRYWDEGITLVDGCSPCSPGCDHCWSAAQAHRFKREGDPGHSSGILTGEGGKFNGDVICYPDRLKRFNTRKPKVFAIWNDLFHEDVPEDFIDDVMVAISKNQQNTYLILTKRPACMLKYYQPMQDIMKGFNSDYDMPTVFNGLTICNQAEADEKIPIFLQVPGKKYLSIEPMLGAIDLMKASYINQSFTFGKINAVILGGETGPGARPMNLNWVRSIRDQCAAANVPFFFKGWGKHEPTSQNWSILKKGRELDKRTHYDLPWK
jgi:protein gp37